MGDRRHDRRPDLAAQRGTANPCRRDGNGRLAITQGRPALVDPERGNAELLHPETGAVARSVRLDLRPDDAVVVSGSPDQSRLLVATSGRGELITCTFDAGSCAEPVRIGSAGAELGTPVEVGNHVVVPDYSTGQATIVDLATSRVVTQLQLFDRPIRFELIAHDGIVFFNDPNSNAAGVLDLSGGIRTITKYTPAGSDAPPTPEHRAQADQVTNADRQKQQPSVGLPGRTVRPSQPNPTPPAPAPAASIVVRPGNRGVVGDEFELTMLLRQPGNATTRWWFSDGTEATGSTVRHSWRQPGAFTVRADTTFDTGTKVTCGDHDHRGPHAGTAAHHPVEHPVGQAGDRGIGALQRQHCRKSGRVVLDRHQTG